MRPLSIRSRNAFAPSALMTTLTTGVLGYVTRETLGDAGGSGQQLMELLERARTAEARATFAEQQLANAGYGAFAMQSPQRLSDDEELARMRGGSSRHVVLWGTLLVLTGGLAVGYFAGYVPLQDRLDAQRKLAQTKEQQHTQALAGLRSRFDAERDALEAQLRAAQTAHAGSTPAPASAAAHEAPIPTVTAPARTAEPPVSAKPEPDATEVSSARAVPDAVGWAGPPGGGVTTLLLCWPVLAVPVFPPPFELLVLFD